MLLGIVIDVKLEQDWKATPPIDVTLLPMITETRPQCSKAKFPIEVTELGIVNEVKLEQWLNAFSSIVVTLLPIETDAILLHPSKALTLIVVTELPMITEVNPEQL